MILTRTNPEEYVLNINGEKVNVCLEEEGDLFTFSFSCNEFFNDHYLEDEAGINVGEFLEANGIEPADWSDEFYFFETVEDTHRALRLLVAEYNLRMEKKLAPATTKTLDDMKDAGLIALKRVTPSAAQAFEALQASRKSAKTETVEAQKKLVNLEQGPKLIQSQTSRTPEIKVNEDDVVVISTRRGASRIKLTL